MRVYCIVVNAYSVNEPSEKSIFVRYILYTHVYTAFICRVSDRKKQDRNKYHINVYIYT